MTGEPAARASRTLFWTPQEIWIGAIEIAWTRNGLTSGTKPVTVTFGSLDNSVTFGAGFRPTMVHWSVGFWW